MNEQALSFTDRNVVITEDGSSTFRLKQYPEHFHSTHGALNESIHIYIQTGLLQIKKRDINILEVGFGTGLNAILTLRYAKKKNIFYHALEAYPLTPEEVKQLNYQSWMNNEEAQCFREMHSTLVQYPDFLSPCFSFRKEICKVENILLENDFYDLIYFDAFSPDIQPELWEEKNFEKLYKAMRVSSILITYCAKGIVKRAMKNAGFHVEGVAGPKGKREITRCTKK